MYLREWKSRTPSPTTPIAETSNAQMLRKWKWTAHYNRSRKQTHASESQRVNMEIKQFLRSFVGETNLTVAATRFKPIWISTRLRSAIFRNIEAR